MGFYIFFISFILILCGRYRLSIKIDLNKQLGFKISIFFIIIVSCLRFNIGYDWSSYLQYVYPYYNPINTIRLEPFDRIICYISGTLHSPLILFSIYAILTYYFIGKVIEENSIASYESLMIYLCLFYLISLSTIRQAVADAIVFYGYKYIKEKKMGKYFLTCVCAALFHKTALVGVFIYFLYHLNKYTTFILAGIVFVGIKVLLPKIIGVFFPIFLIYLNKSGLASSSGNLQKLFYSFLYFYSLVLLPKDKESEGLLNICTIGVILPFILGGHTGGRLAEYYLIYYSLLLPKCNKKFKIEYRILFLFPFYLYFFMYLYTSVNVNKSNEYVPFKWYFLESLNQDLQ